MVEILKRFLRPLGAEMDSANDLEPAMEMARAKEYNVIILDLRLRYSGKQESLHAIREFKSRHAVVVVVSGLAEPNIREEVMAAGADAFVPKDGSFTGRALILATNIATLKLPRESFSEHDFLEQVEMFRKLAEAL